MIIKIPMLTSMDFNWTAFTDSVPLSVMFSSSFVIFF